MTQKTRILNMDESSYDKWGYHYRTWRKKGQRNEIQQTKIKPAVTLVVVADSTGSIYSSLLQSNSNEKTTMLMIVELVQRLDEEDTDWRDNSVLLLDNV
jgi:hypothetical protein